MDLQVISLLYFRKAISCSDMSRPGGATCYLELYESSDGNVGDECHVSSQVRLERYTCTYDSCPLKVYEKVIMTLSSFGILIVKTYQNARSAKL
jgi:hypothetical protein